MTLTEEITSEVYGVLMVLGVVMNEQEALDALKKAGFDHEISKLILDTALEVQEITRQHNDKLNEISSQVQLTTDQTEHLAKAYLEAQGISAELIEVVYLFHSYQTSLDISEEVIIQAEKQGLSDKEVIKNIQDLGSLDKATAEAMYITAMTRLGKPYVLSDKSGKYYIFFGLISLFMSLLFYVSDLANLLVYSFVIFGVGLLGNGFYKALK